MQELNKSELENVCRAFSSAAQGVLSWKWDSYLEAALAEFSVDKQDSVRGLLERHLSNVWDSSNIDEASNTVQMIAGNLGGLRPGQVLFISEPNQDVFGAWWPWDNGERISIRVGPYDESLSDSQRTELVESFQGWFGLS